VPTISNGFEQVPLAWASCWVEVIRSRLLQIINIRRPWCRQHHGPIN